MAARILGISCDYHDAAACLLEDGQLVAAAQEERFTRRKHDARFPRRAIRYCLAEAGLAGTSARIDAVAYYDKPILKLHRILETALGVAPRGVRPLARALPVWLRERLWIEPTIHGALADLGVENEPAVYFPEHHLSHAASAFFPSPFDEAAVVTIDGVGEWATTTVGVGEGREVRLLEQVDFPHSLGLLYSAFTAYCGFRVNDGEYKLMGLAPYGEPRFADAIREHLVDLRPDGSFRLDTRHFGYLGGLRMTNRRFHDLFGGPPRAPVAPLEVRHADLAASVQRVLEEAVLAIAERARKRTGKRFLCLAGGVALNCVANGVILRSGLFDDLWIQPASGDAGGAVGAAYAVWHGAFDGEAESRTGRDGMRSACLGPAFEAADIQAFLDEKGVRYERLDDDAWAARVAGLLAEGCIVGLFQGRMEYGPRALGNRSILADPRDPTVQSRLNLAIKGRESFRPFAPAVLAERVADCFALDRPSPYMLLVARVNDALHVAPDPADAPGPDDFAARLSQRRSTLPAVTHVDHSARIQTVSAEDHPRFHRLLRAFESVTGCPVLVNTSFNVKDEPIVCTPAEALDCFERTGMDALSLGPFLLA